MLRVVLELSSRGRWHTIFVGWVALLNAEKNTPCGMLMYVYCWLPRWVLIKRDHSEVPVVYEFSLEIYDTTYGDEDKSQNCGAADV